jgi:hypothetical protein
MKDIVVEEVRKIRHQIEQEFNHDVAMYLKHVYKEQKKHGDRLVRRQPKLIRKHKAV